MAWFLNYYTCARCGEDWTDEWSCMCDDDCPHCGARHMSPDDSDNLTHVIEKRAREYVVLWSPETAEHDPDYRELGSFPTRQQALNWLSVDDSDAEVA
jgi:predicted  nucleic acid-binding Zn-ribbon protein